MLAALFDVPANLGYPLLFALVAGASAGALIPGEKALIVRTPSRVRRYSRLGPALRAGFA